MNPTYILKRYRLGWILCGNQNYTGIPLNALNECKGLFEPGALIHPGILHHIKMVHDNTAVFALATKANGDKWIEEISNSIQILHSQ